MDNESLPLVKEIADIQDTLLASTVDKAMQARGHTFVRPHARWGAAEHNGDLIHRDYRGQVGGLSHTYDRPLAEGTGTRQHNGNVYGWTNEH